ncbi:hypothetical protein ACOTI9_14970 [Achromobacter mucicolens]|uniref:hypothetical protein n=1 Tax=Achromobacter mucicolens TaxID=1389922 RepID=UPI003B9B2CBB
MSLTNTAVPALQEAVLTDDEILTATLYGQSEARMIRNGRAIESALLSKLRAPVAGEAKEDLAPPKCPITGRPFFMAIEHPKLGMVPTYGGPYDSYTIPHLDGKPDQPRHERELYVYRYDHDLGGWRTDEVEVIPLRIVHEDVLHGLEDAAPQASEAVRALLESWQAVADRIVEQYGGVVAGVDFGALGRANRAALSAQPGAQKGGGDA